MMDKVEIEKKKQQNTTWKENVHIKMRKRNDRNNARDDISSALTTAFGCRFFPHSLSLSLSLSPSFSELKCTTEDIVEYRRCILNFAAKAISRWDNFCFALLCFVLLRTRFGVNFEMHFVVNCIWVARSIPLASLILPTVGITINKRHEKLKEKKEKNHWNTIYTNRPSDRKIESFICTQ